MKMDIEKEIKKNKEKIDRQLRKFFEAQLRKSRAVSPYTHEIMEHMAEFSLRGGKRIRPMLLMTGYRLFGTSDEKQIVKAAIAVELMESFLLIHDDVIDRDELRRGYLTFHKIYENKSKKKFKKCDPAHFGNSMAILAGDILSILGKEAILSSGFPVKNKLAAIEKFNEIIISTCFGQVLDIVSEYDPSFKASDLSKVHKLKTAVYTIEGPLMIGAILAGAQKERMKVISRYAIPLGKAFQLKDDILGMYGTQQKIGKPVGSDIREGKRTLLILKALEKADEKQKKVILGALGNPNLTENQIDDVKRIVIETGSLKHSEDLAFALASKAKSVVLKEKLPREPKEFLIGLADYVIRREK